MSKKYAVTIMRFDDGDPEDTGEQLVDQYLTADQAIDLMLHIKEHFEESGTEEHEDDEEEEEEPEPEPQQKTRRVRTCSQCGEPGHTYRTCGKKSSTSPEPARDEEVAEPEEPSEPGADHRSLRERVKELWEAGVGLEDVFDALPSDPIPEISAIHRDLERKRND